MVRFSGEPTVPQCPRHGDLGTPNNYDESTDSLMYMCPMCSLENGTHYVSIDEFPVDALEYVYRKTAKVDNSIRRKESDDKTRFDELTAAVRKELNSRGESIPDTDLSHGVRMSKDEALELQSEVPGIIQIGRAAEEYEFGTLPEDMEWEVLVTESEAEFLEDEVNAETWPVDAPLN